MRKLVLVVVATLLRNMSVPLLHHMNIHQPVCKLLASCKAHPRIERSEFVSLLYTLLVKIQKEDISLVCFFFENKVNLKHNTSFLTLIRQDEQPDFLIFSSLVPYLTADGSDGELARTALVLSLGFCSVSMVTEYILQSSFLHHLVSVLLSPWYNSDALSFGMHRNLD